MENKAKGRMGWTGQAVGNAKTEMAGQSKVLDNGTMYLITVGGGGIALLLMTVFLLLFASGLVGTASDTTVRILFGGFGLLIMMVGAAQLASMEKIRLVIDRGSGTVESTRFSLMRGANSEWFSMAQIKAMKLIRARASWDGKPIKPGAFTIGTKGAVQFLQFDMTDGSSKFYRAVLDSKDNAQALAEWMGKPFSYDDWLPGLLSLFKPSAGNGP